MVESMNVLNLFLFLFHLFNLIWTPVTPIIKLPSHGNPISEVQLKVAR